MKVLWCVLSVASIGISSRPGVAQSITGTVVEDHSSAAVGRAALRIQRIGANFDKRSESDRDGRFSSELPPGEYFIAASKAGYQSTRARVHVSEGVGTDFTVRMVRCGAINGAVNDETGQPVRGAKVVAVRITETDTSIASATTVKASIVDERGRYRVSDLIPGTYILMATVRGSGQGDSRNSGNRGFGPGVFTFPVGSPPRHFVVAGGDDFREANFTIVASPLFSLTGRVRGMRDGDTFFATLTPISRPSASIAAAPVSVNGSFRFDGIGNGAFYLSVAGPVEARGGRGLLLGVQPSFGRTRVDVTGADVSDIEVTIRPGVSLSLEVGMDRSTVARCGISGQFVVRPVDDWGVTLDRSGVGIAGQEIRLDGLAPAIYLIESMTPDSYCASVANTTVDLTGAVSRTALVTMQQSGAIGGNIVDAPKTPGIVLVLLPEAVLGAQRLDVVVPSADGRFVFENVRPGQYRLRPRSMADSRSSWMQGDSRQDVAVKVSPGLPAEVTVSGRAVKQN